MIGREPEDQLREEDNRKKRIETHEECKTDTKQTSAYFGSATAYTFPDGAFPFPLRNFSAWSLFDVSWDERVLCCDSLGHGIKCSCLCSPPTLSLLRASLYQRFALSVVVVSLLLFLFVNWTVFAGCGWRSSVDVWQGPHLSDWVRRRFIWYAILLVFFRCLLLSFTALKPFFVCILWVILSALFGVEPSLKSLFLSPYTR